MLRLPQGFNPPSRLAGAATSRRGDPPAATEAERGAVHQCDLGAAGGLSATAFNVASNEFLGSGKEKAEPQYKGKVCCPKP